MAPPADCPGAEANQYKPRNRSKLNRRLIDFSGINEAALAVLPSLLTEWLPGGTTKGVEYVARNPTRADRRPGSFTVNVLTGRWADFSTNDTGGDVISLRAYLDGIGQGEAARRLAFEIGVDADRKYGKDGEVKAPPEHRVYAPSSMTATKNTEKARSIWNASEPIAKSSGEVYFRQCRNIHIPLPVSLRFNRHLYHYPSRRRFPAVVSAIQSPSGGVTAIHRIFLAPDGLGKAPVDEPKMSLGPMGVGAVRLAPADTELGLAEGIENALSAMQMFGVPCWAALGTRLAQVWLPSEVRHVIVFGDRGDAGEDAAERAKKLLKVQGREVTIALPETENDWNAELRNAAVKRSYAVNPATAEK